MAVSIALSTFIGANVEDVYLALTTQQGLASFWTSESQAEPVIGSLSHFRFPSGSQLELRVEELEASRRVIWTLLNDLQMGAHWTGTRVTWELTRIEHLVTIALFQQTDWPAETTQADLAGVAYIWAQVLRKLKDYTETGTPQPYFGRSVTAR